MSTGWVNHGTGFLVRTHVCSVILAGVENFQFLAFAYLSDWWQYDGPFVSGLSSSNDRNVRLNWLKEAATYYQVIRNFAKGEEPPGEERMGRALDAVDAAVASIPTALTPDAVDGIVDGLARRFNSDYKKQLLSAASKFLWLRMKSPFVIFDQRASTWLKKLSGSSLKDGYAGYRLEWLKQFAERERAIADASAKLSCAVPYLPDWETPQSLKSTVTSRWFHERVFDKYLWWNGRGQAT